MLHLGYNHLSGPINLTNFPPNLVDLSLPKNQFSGTAIMNNLPKSLQALDVHGNEQLCGEVDASTLPTILYSFLYSDTKIILQA